MEVKSVYLDLQKAELNKKGKKSVWKLESEAFKEPLELKIGYEDKELEKFMERCYGLEKSILSLCKRIDSLDEQQKTNESCFIGFTWRMNDHWRIIWWLREKIENQNKEISQLYKVIADAKTTIETQSGTILHLWDRVKELEKKITKQPMVYSDKTFISGHERCGLSMIEIPSGDYLVISKYVIGECNEFVTNRNDVVMEKITVNDNCYVPMYQLVGWTDLDTPTATIYWTLTFIPC